MMKRLLPFCTITLLLLLPANAALAVVEATTVPEPATMLLLGTGLVGLAVIARKNIFKK